MTKHEYLRDLRVRRKEAGKCPRCGKAPEAGKAHCAPCTASKVRSPESARRYRAKLVKKAQKQGLCVRCFKRPVEPDRKKCAKCLAYQPPNLRATLVRQKYGIDLRTYDRLMQQQDGKCAVCRDRCSTGRRLAVDHDHDTKRVRGLLCTRCNVGIGYFLNDPVRLRAAAKYLSAG